MIYKRLLVSPQSLCAAWRWCSSATGASVVTRVEGGLGLVTLNRPRALNSLNLDMIRSLTPVLRAWQQRDSGVRAVMVRGAGGKAFCAGGDIRALTEVPGGEMQKTFFRLKKQFSSTSVYKLTAMPGRSISWITWWAASPSPTLPS